MKPGFLQKIKLFLFYKRSIKESSNILNENFDLRIDRVYRLYTVINLPDDTKTYGKPLTDKYIKEYITKVDNYFLTIGMSELIGVFKVEKVDVNSYLVVFGYSLANTAKVANRLIYLSIAVSLSLIYYFL